MHYLAILSFILTDIVIFPFIEISQRSFQAVGKMGTFALISNLHILIRLSLCLFSIYLLNVSLTIDSWSLMYLTSTLLGALIATTTCASYFEIQKSHLKLQPISSGIRLSLSTMILKLFVDGDKFILSLFVLPSTVGNYSAAFRLMEISLIPIKGTLGALYRNLMKEKDPKDQSIFNILSLTFLYGLISSAVLFASSHYITYVFGEDFSLAEEILQWLSAYPLIFLIRQLLVAQLDASEAFIVKSRILSISILIALTAALILINIIGWLGAIASIYLGEFSIIMLSTFSRHYSYPKTRKSSE